MKTFDFCEYHIDLDKWDMGMFHIVAEDRVSDDIIESLKNAITRLSFQYNNSVLKCVEYIESFKVLEDEDVSFAPTDGDLHLLSVSDYINYCTNNPIDSPQVYIMSHDLYLKFRERAESKNKDRIFETLIQEVYEREGLLYGAIELKEEDTDVLQTES